MSNTKTLKEAIMAHKSWQNTMLTDLADICIAGEDGGILLERMHCQPLPTKYAPATSDKYWRWLQKNHPEIYRMLYDKIVNEGWFIGHFGPGIPENQLWDALKDVTAFDTLALINVCWFWPIVLKENGLPIREYDEVDLGDEDDDGPTEYGRCMAISAEKSIDFFLEYVEDNAELEALMTKSLLHIKKQGNIFKGLAAFLGEDVSGINPSDFM